MTSEAIQHSEPTNGPNGVQEEKTANFLSRVGSLPLVVSAFGTAKSYYDGTKQRFSVVEQAERELMTRVVPQVTQIGNQATQAAPPSAQAAFSQGLSSLDYYACQGLDGLEKRVPLIKEPTERVFERVDHVIDSALQFSETQVNFYLPEEEEQQEGGEQAKENGNGKEKDDDSSSDPDAPVSKKQKTSHLSRAQTLGGVLSKRLSSKAQKQIASLKEKTPIDIQKIISADLIRRASETIEGQVAYARQNFQEGQLSKVLDLQFTELKVRLAIAVEKVEQMTPNNVKEISKNVFSGLSKGFADFADALSKVFAQINADPQTRNFFSALQGSLAFFSASAASLANVSPKKAVEGEEEKAKEVEMKEQQEAEKVEEPKSE